MLPTIALVGRPNVGKSTLFNLLTRSHDALVADQPGVTRDRHYGVCHLHETPVIIVDTGGISEQGDDIDDLTNAQVRLAIDESDLIVFIVDARDGVLPGDHVILKQLRRTGKPVVLAVNKADHANKSSAWSEFSELGFAHPAVLSAAQNQGISALLAYIFKQLPRKEEGWLTQEPDNEGVRVAVVGRPNAGKSTLVNRLIGEDRLVVSDVAGTTRDSIRIPLERDGKKYTLIDTAGLRRRARVSDGVEKISTIKSLQSIALSQVVIVVIDAHEHPADQDVTLASRAIEEGKALVIALNKWDGMSTYERDQCKRLLDRRFNFAPWVKRVFISAQYGSGLGELMDAVYRAYSAATSELTSSQLTRALEAAYESNPPPLVQGRSPKLRFAHPGGSNPPTIVIHGTRTKHLNRAYKKYLENTFRKRFELEGTPVRIRLRDSDNPFAGRHNELTEKQRSKRRRLMRHVKKRRK